MCKTISLNACLTRRALTQKYPSGKAGAKAIAEIVVPYGVGLEFRVGMLSV